MKGSLSLKILSSLGDAALDFAELMDVFLTAPYGTSLRDFEYRLSRSNVRSKIKKLFKADSEKICYYNTLYALKKQGLIIEERSHEKRFLRLTAGGRKKLKELQKRQQRSLPLPEYPKTRNKVKFLIITYDIPEKYRDRRAWLRKVLRNLGLTMVQKSVWAGKAAVPERFLSHLAEYSLTRFVEIFEISNVGTLRVLE